MSRPVRPIAERLLEKVQKTAGGCWLFTGCKLASGYGKISIARSRAAFAHRVSYQEFVGAIPDGLYVLHTPNYRYVNHWNKRRGLVSKTDESEHGSR